MTCRLSKVRVEGLLSFFGVGFEVSGSLALEGFGVAFSVDEAVARAYDGGAMLTYE